MSTHERKPESEEPDPVVRAYLAHVDRTLIERNLRLTPEERLRQLMDLQKWADELARAGREARSRSTEGRSLGRPSNLKRPLRLARTFLPSRAPALPSRSA